MRVGLREVMVGVVILAAVSAVFRGIVLQLISGPARPSEQPVEAYRPSGKVILYVPLPRRRYAAGDDIPLDWRFHNDTTEPITVWFGRANYNLVVCEERGDEAPLTKEGRRRRTAFLERSANLDHPDIPSVLPSGASSGMISWGNGISAWYDLRPGRYTVELTYREDSRSTRFETRSARVSFDVVAAQSGAAATSAAAGPSQR
jgi:hypothetical protein